MADPLAQLEHAPILVLGDVHSGAAWVADVLSAHSQVAGVSELRLFTGMGLEPPFRDSHWNPESSERMFDRRMGFGQFLTQERVTTDLRALAGRWLARALSPEHRFLVERSPGGAPGARAFARLYPEGMVIYVVRDGRALARAQLGELESRLRSSEGPAPPPLWRRLWSTGGGWAAYVTSMRELADTTAIPVHELRCEDLVARPEDVARRLFELCGIDCNEGTLAGILKSVGEPPLGAVGAWSRFERVVYSAGAGELLHELGYAPPPAPGIRLVRQLLLGYERVKRLL